MGDPVQRTLNQINSVRLMLENIAVNLDILSDEKTDSNELNDLSEVKHLQAIVDKEAENFNADRVSDEFRQAVVAFLENRWHRVRNTAKCYTINQHYIFNIICIALAEYIDPASKNSLLMPIKHLEDVNYTSINELQLGEFIIDDAGEWFILIEDIIEEACARMIAEQSPIYVNRNKAQHLCELSAAEIGRLGYLAATLNAMAAWYSHLSGNVLSELARLRDCLLRGQVGHNDGEEMNAGRAANEGIAEFNAVYMLLSPEEKQRMRAIHDEDRTIGYVLDILFRDPSLGYESVTTCIQLLGRRLEMILAYGDNAAQLSGMSMDTRHRLNNLVALVKSQFHTRDLIANDDPMSRTSRLNPDMQFDDSHWVVSLIAPKTHSRIPTHTKIIVEGLVDGQLFVGSYYPLAKPGATWPIIPDVLQNTAGVFSKIKHFESQGYRQIPLQAADGQVNINDQGEIVFKFDLIAELRSSLARSHVVSAEAAKNMIAAIKAEARRTEIANWVSPLDGAEQAPSAVDAVMANSVRFSLFTPFERFGNKSLVGTGKHNCVTWCEEKLAVAGCDYTSMLDYGKSKPVTHTHLF